MITRDKILEFMYNARHRLEEDWTQDLEELNIYDDVAPIYIAEGVKGDTRIGNTILCFTVLAYDNKSKFIDPHKDRWENKQKILVTLAGLSCMTVPVYQEVIYNKHKESYNLSEWYVKYQKDWRWTSVISGQEYHSMATKMANAGAVDSPEAIHMGKMLVQADELRLRADKLLEELRTEFLNLDTLLEKEERVKATDVDSANFMSFEIYLANRNKQKKQKL